MLERFKLLLKLETDRNALVEHNVGEITSGIKWSGIVTELEKSRKSVVRREVTFNKPLKYKGDCVFYPIFDLRNKLSYIVCILEEVEIIGELAVKTEQIKGGTKM